MIADRRIYLNRERTLAVEEGDPRAASLLISKGGEIDDAIAKKFGLVESGGGLVTGSRAEVKEVVHPSEPPPVFSKPQTIVETFKARRGRPPKQT